MPARHDILCGALDFLWKPWGSIELWEESITATLRRAGVTTMLVSDHPHLFETGGENYHTDFSAWDYVRGHEGDPWHTAADPSAYGMPSAVDGGWFIRERFGIDDTKAGRRHYDDSRTWFRAEDDFPGPRTMRTAASWLRDQASAHDRWMLFVDEFDPHEPFDTPEPWASMYDDEPWDDDRLIWPPYIVGGIASGALTERQGRHIRANYGAKLSMIDHWFGEVVAELDAQQLWDTTAVIVCTDHGHYLGDVRRAGPSGDGAATDIWGKPVVPQFEPLGHTPLLVHWPGRPAGDVDALTTNVDLNATIADIFGVEAAHRTHGRSMVPLLADEADSIREWAVGGVFGNWVQVTDGRRKYARAPEADNFPLSMWSNRWSTMPVPQAFADFMTFPKPDALGLARHDAGIGHPGDPPTVRAGRPAPVLGGRRRTRRRAPPVRRVERSDRNREPSRGARRARDDRPAPFGAHRGRGSRRAAGPAGPRVAVRRRGARGPGRSRPPRR